MQPYKKLYTYWYSVILYDRGVEFCNKYLAPQEQVVSNLSNLRNLRRRQSFGHKAYAWRLADQIIGALRSGKQNIVEGSDALATSIKSGIKLTGVAKASEEEALADIEDYARQRGLPLWDKSDPRVKLLRAESSKIVRNLSNLSNPSTRANARYGAGLRDPRDRADQEKELLAQLPLPQGEEEAVNFLLTLLHQETYLLHRQIEALMKKHEREGGLTEKLYRKRTDYRGY